MWQYIVGTDAIVPAWGYILAATYLSALCQESSIGTVPETKHSLVSRGPEYDRLFRLFG